MKSTKNSGIEGGLDSPGGGLGRKLIVMFFFVNFVFFVVDRSFYPGKR